MTRSLSGGLRSSKVARHSVNTLFRPTSVHGVRRVSTAKALEKEKVTEPEVPSAPLSALPTYVLLRSLLINTVSSKPYLLTPALAFVSALCKPSRGIILNPDRNVLLHSLLKKTFYNQFCAGETVAETRATMDQLQKMGFRGTILTYGKETIFNQNTNVEHGLGVSTNEQNKSHKCEHIEAWREGTLKTVDMLIEGDQLAVK